MRTICVVTNNRADYSRLKTILEALQSYPDVRLQLFVAGSHLLPNFGNTIEDIVRDGFTVTYQLFTEVEGDKLGTMAKSTGLAIMELSSAFHNYQPDLVVVHGDRFEALAAAIAASFMNIPVAHIQGGERTGSIDEHIRHAITKLAQFHFPSTPDAAQRIARLGEPASNIFMVGCPASDLLLREPVTTFAQLCAMLAPYIKDAEWFERFSAGDFFLVSYHPVTTQFRDAGRDVHELLSALATFARPCVLLWPNIDVGCDTIIKAIQLFLRTERASSWLGTFSHLPMAVFVQFMRHASVMIGNSSAGIREACYFGTPVVNVGTRQQGRERTCNTMDVPAQREQIIDAIRTQMTVGRYAIEPRFGDGTAGVRIAQTVREVSLEHTQKLIIY